MFGDKQFFIVAGGGVGGEMGGCAVLRRVFHNIPVLCPLEAS